MDIIKKISDEVVEVMNLTRSSNMNSKNSQKLYLQSLTLDGKQQQILDNFFLKTIDQILYYFLWIIEQSVEIDLVYRDPNNPDKIVSLKEISDELCGELYNEEGWIEKYSKYPIFMKL